MLSVLTVIGLFILIEGVPYFCFPDKVKNLAMRIQEIPSPSLRTFGFVLMLLGLFIVFISEKLL